MTIREQLEMRDLLNEAKETANLLNQKLEEQMIDFTSQAIMMGTSPSLKVKTPRNAPDQDSSRTK